VSAAKARHCLFWALLTLLALPAAAGSGPGTTDARSLLRQMLHAENTVALSGTQVTTLVRDGQEVSSQQRVLRNGTHGVRMEYVAPPRFAGELVVDNGRVYWHYVPVTNTLETGPSHLMRLRRRVPQVMQQIKRGQLDVQYQGLDTVAGRACAVVQVRPMQAGAAPWRRFWIDTANGAQLRIEQYSPSGQRVSASAYTDVSYAPALDKDSFRIPPTPKGARVVALDAGPPLPSVAQAQAQVGFPIASPMYLPPGFRFQSASVSDYGGRKLVTLRYLNGLNVLSLFETPTNHAPRGPGGAVEHPRRNVTQRIVNGLRVILVSTLPPDEMERVLGSVR